MKNVASSNSKRLKIKILAETIPKKRSIRLRSALDVRRLLSKLINGTYRDEIDTTKATKIAYLCNVFLKSHEISEIESRLSALEKKTND